MSETFWYYSRVCVEGLHALLWMFLIIAAVCFPTSKLLIPVLLLAAIPTGWIAAGACPLSLLENYLCPIHTSDKCISNDRNRAGAKIRKYLHMNLETWDSLLLYLICLLAVVYAVRMCNHLL